MERNTMILMVLFLTFTVRVNGQINPIADLVITHEKARYLKEDLTHFLSKNVEYPKIGIQQNRQGDVVVSFIITENGELNGLALESSPEVSLSTSSIAVMNKMNKAWSPAKINQVATEKKYLLVFRYRLFLNTKPNDYKQKADEYFEKQKYEKAIKLYTDALKDNPYDQKLFESRSKAKEFTGDLEGAKLDHLASIELEGEIMSVVDVFLFGVTRPNYSRDKAHRTKIYQPW